MKSNFFFIIQLGENHPKVVYDRDYKKFSNDLLRNDILQAQA